LTRISPVTENINLSFLVDAFSQAQQWLFEAVVQPVVFGLGQGALVEDAFVATGWLLLGLLQLVVIAVVFGALQRWRPVEPVIDKATVRTDVVYTLIHRLGLFRLGLFFALDPLFDTVFGWARANGFAGVHLEQLWPGVTDTAWVSLLIYLVVFDAVDYWIHRGQHHFNWWWQLHSLHHAQRQMTMWSDNRNHVLDDMLRDTIIVLVAQLIGVAPGQFMVVVAITQLSESLQHANVRLWFGSLGERLWVSPRFHRLHHAIGLGHESEKNGKTVLGGHNFGVLLPWWDMLWRTANFEHRYDPTGVRDQVTEGRQYGKGLVQQQWLGFKRLFGRG
jgi:sterol desaturase/sphingolipid hydroxylase (fatty acid hydroxylase superfamily)